MPMSDKEKAELEKRLNDAIDSCWSHVTPGTPDHFYVEQAKRKLREAITPAPAQPAAPAKD